MRPYALFLGIAATAVAATASVSAGELGRVTVSPHMPWTPTACVRPNLPLGLGYDASTLNVVVSDYNKYANAAQAYMDCVSRESLADRTATQQAIEAAEQRLNADMLAEVNAARARLTSGQSSIR